MVHDTSSLSITSIRTIVMTRDPPIIHSVILEEMVKKSTIKTKVGSGQSGLGADSWTKILMLNMSGSCAVVVCKPKEDFIKHICVYEVEIKDKKSFLESFLACRLPLDENLGLRPTGVGLGVVKDDVTIAVANLYFCGSQEVGCETAIRLIKQN